MLSSQRTNRPKAIRPVEGLTLTTEAAQLSKTSAACPLNGVSSEQPEVKMTELTKNIA